MASCVRVGEEGRGQTGAGEQRVWRHLEANGRGNLADTRAGAALVAWGASLTCLQILQESESISSGCANS